MKMERRNIFPLILTNFPKTLTVDELSSSLEVHRRNFEKEFRKTFGLSCIQFVRALRMHEASHLMQYTHFSHGDIADYLRYIHETHFARDCRKVFGLNPKQLRELSEQEFQALLKNYMLSKK